MSGERGLGGSLEYAAAIDEREHDVELAPRNEYGVPIVPSRDPGRRPAIMRRAGAAGAPPKAEGAGVAELERLLASRAPASPDLTALATVLARHPSEDQPIRAAIERALGTESCIAVIRGASEIRTAAMDAEGPASELGAESEIPYRSEMEAAFGRSFADVRAHLGPEAHASAAALSAHAYTKGNRLVFATATPPKDLVAHELTHVVQQHDGLAPESGISQPGDAVELEAERVAAVVASGGSAAGLISTTAPTPHVARKAKGDAASSPSKGEGLTYEQAHNKLEWAYKAALPRHKDYAGAATLLGEVDAWLKDIASGKDLQDKFAGKVGAVEQARGLVGYAITALRTTLLILRQGRNASRGQWQVTFSSFKAARPWLVTLSGEVAFKDNKVLTDIESVTADAMKVETAVAAIPVALAIGAVVAPLLIEELSMMGGTALLNFTLTNPIIATELGVFAVGAAINIQMQGGIDQYLENLKTDEGQAQAAQDLLVILHMVLANTPGEPSPRSRTGGVHPEQGAPEPAPPPRRMRVEAKVHEEEGQLRGRITRIEPENGAETAALGTPSRTAARQPPQLSPQEEGAVEWARRLAESTPEELRDPARLAKLKAEYAERQAQINKVYNEIMRGEREAPPGVSRERLRLAMEGDPETGERIPLTFPDQETYREFQADVRAVFESEGITDAVVQQVGSATKGFKGNPNKPFGPWTPESDADFAVFSAQALVQAQEVKVPVNQKVTMDGRYTVLKNEGLSGGKGFEDTRLGEKLAHLATRWKVRIWPDDPAADGIDFKMNLTTEPFSDATTVIDMRGGQQ
jgi:hypothetical protein